MSRGRPWRNIFGNTFPAVCPERVFDTWVDEIDFTSSRKTKKPCPRGAGQRFSLLDGFIQGEYAETIRPRRIVFRCRFEDFPAKAPDSSVEVTLESKGDGTEIGIIQTFPAEISEAAQGYRYWMLWCHKVFPRLLRRVQQAERPQKPSVAARPPVDAELDALIAWLGPERETEGWTARLVDLAARATEQDRASLWWKCAGKPQQGMQLWVRGLRRWQKPCLVRAALHAAHLARPVWKAAERSRPEVYLDLAAGFDAEGNGPPSVQLKAVAAWLKRPDPETRDAARATTDQTRQLRFSDEEMGDLHEQRFLYALEASTATVLAIDDDGTSEAELAVLTSLEAIRRRRDRVMPAEVARVGEAVRSGLLRWARTGRHGSR